MRVRPAGGSSCVPVGRLAAAHPGQRRKPGTFRKTPIRDVTPAAYCTQGSHLCGWTPFEDNDRVQSWFLEVPAPIRAGGRGAHLCGAWWLTLSVTDPEWNR